MVFSWKGFWFLGALVGVVWAAIVRSWLRPSVVANPGLKPVARRLIIGVGLTFSIPFVALGVIQILSGQSRWTYVYSRELGNPGVVTAWAVVALWYGFMAWWVWSGGIDRSLATFGDRLPERLREPISVKIALSVLLVLFFGQYVLTVLRGGPSFAAG